MTAQLRPSSQADSVPIGLYHAWRSSASRRVRLVLAEKGLGFSSHAMDLLRGDQHAPEYLAVNPSGVVPALVHNGRVLADSAVISEYLDEAFPQPPLMPDDPLGRAQVRSLLRHIDEVCLPQLIVFNWSQVMQPQASAWSDAQLQERLARVPSAERREAWTRVARRPYSDDEKAKALSVLHGLLDRLAGMLVEHGGPWLMGARHTLADIGAVPFAMRIGEIDATAWEARPAVARWWDAVRARPSFATARIEAFLPSA